MKKKTKISIISALACTMAVAGGALVTVAHTNADAVWDDVVIEDCAYGTEFSIPERFVMVNGTPALAKGTLTFPNGKSTSQKTIVLDQVGKYKVQYSVKVDKLYIKEETFTVNAAAYTYSDTQTQVYYMDKTPNGEEREGEFKYISGSCEGLMARIMENDKVEFQDFIQIPKQDKLVPLAKFFIAPTTQGQADFIKLNLVFTDVMDPTNTLRIQISASPNNSTAGWAVGNTYVSACGTGQLLKGLEGKDKLHTNDGYGAVVNRTSFYGKKALNSNDSEPCDPSLYQTEISLNPETCEIYANGVFVIDLNSNDYFGGLTDVKWNGFTSDLVKLSVYGADYNTSSANVVFTSIKDLNLKNKFVYDEEAPVITVDTEYEYNAMPDARLGLGYLVPTATAHDLFSGDCTVTTSVYYNYTSDNRVLKDVVNGKFTPTDKGQYAIVYEATDMVGNVGKEVLWVNAGTTIADMDIQIPETKQTTAELGTKVIVPNVTVTGGSGNKTVSVKAFNGNNVIDIGTEKTEWSFYPEAIGDWTVEYTATDYTGVKKTATYTVGTTIPEKPSFKDEVRLPKIYVAGFEYTLPELTVYDYRTGSAKLEKASVKVVDANGEKTYVSGEKFTPKVNNTGDMIEITYEYNYGTGVVAQATKYVPTIISTDESKALQSGNYFYSAENTFTTTKTNNGLKFDATQSGTQKWAFANELIANGFSIYLETVKEKANYSSMVIKLTDSEDESENLQIELQKKGEGYTLKFGRVTDNVMMPAEMNGLREITVEYRNERILVNGIAYDPELTSEGKKFNGFASGKVNLEFEVKDAVAGAEYYVYSLNGHTLTTSSRDRVAPVISVKGDCGGTRTIGTTYEICPAVVADVIAPSVDFSLTVKTPSGQPAKDENGNNLENVNPYTSYKLVLSEYGEYKIEFTATENGYYKNTTTKTYTLKVLDEEAPVAVFENVPEKVVKVGSFVKVPKFTVSDNVSAKEDITVLMTVRNSNGRCTLLETDYFECKFVGEYELRIVVFDKEGNSSLYTFTVKVVE